MWRKSSTTPLRRKRRLQATCRRSSHWSGRPPTPTQPAAQCYHPTIPLDCTPLTIRRCNHHARATNHTSPQLDHQRSEIPPQARSGRIQPAGTNTRSVSGQSPSSLPPRLHRYRPRTEPYPPQQCRSWQSGLKGRLTYSRFTVNQYCCQCTSAALTYVQIRFLPLKHLNLFHLVVCHAQSPRLLPLLL